MGLDIVISSPEQALCARTASTPVLVKLGEGISSLKTKEVENLLPFLIGAPNRLVVQDIKDP